MVAHFPQKMRRLCVVSHARVGLRETIAIRLMMPLRQPVIFIFGSRLNILEEEKRGVQTMLASPLELLTMSDKT